MQAKQLLLFSVVALGLVIGSTPSEAIAQEGQWSIVERVPLNSRIDVERATQVRITGEFQRATADELFLRVDDRTIPILRSDIRRVRMRAGHYAGRGAKWGFLAGAGVGS